MARTRPTNPPVTVGAETRIGRLAEFFRLGQLGAAQPGTQQPARARLESVGEIISDLRATNMLPTAAEGARWSWSYLCLWVDTTTGRPVGRGVRQVVETAANASYQAASSAARQQTLYPADVTQSPPIPTAPHLRLQCRRIGGIIEIPTR